MAITGTNLEAATGTSGSSQATGSIAFANNTLYVVSYATAGAGTVGNGITGGGITWSEVEGTGNQTNESAQVYCGYVTSGASTGALTLSGTGGTVSRMTWSIDTLSGTDASTGGLDAFVQTNVQNRTSAQTSSAVTLATFADGTNNASFQFVHVKASAITISPEGGSTTLAQFAGAGISILTAIKVGNDTSVTSTWTGSATVQAVAAEVAVLSAVTPTRKLRVVTNPARW